MREEGAGVEVVGDGRSNSLPDHGARAVGHYCILEGNLRMLPDPVEAVKEAARRYRTSRLRRHGRFRDPAASLDIVCVKSLNVQVQPIWLLAHHSPIGCAYSVGLLKVIRKS